jgi:hypothetical protein
MEPVSICVGLFFAAAGLLASAEKKRANEELRSAVNRYRNAIENYNDSKRSVAKSSRALDEARVLAYCLYVSMVCDSAGKKSKSKFSFPGVVGKRKLKRGKKNLVSRITAIGGLDKTFVYATGGALLIEGVQFLHRNGVVNVPVFDSSVNDALLNVPGVDLKPLAEALGGAGDIAVADVISSGLIFLSAFRICYNLSKALSISGDASQYNARSGVVEGAASSLWKYSHALEGLTGEARDCSFEAYKLYLIADASEMGSVNFSRAKEMLCMKLGQLWSSINKSASKEVG